MNKPSTQAEADNFNSPKITRTVVVGPDAWEDRKRIENEEGVRFQGPSFEFEYDGRLPEDLNFIENGEINFTKEDVETAYANGKIDDIDQNFLLNVLVLASSSQKAKQEIIDDCRLYVSYLERGIPMEGALFERMQRLGLKHHVFDFPVKLHISKGEEVGSIDLEDALIHGSLIAHDIRVRTSILLNGAQFTGDVNMQGAEVDGDVNMWRAKVDKNVYMGYIKVDGNVYMNYMKVSGNVKIQEAKVDGNVYMPGAKVGGNVRMSESEVGRDVNMRSTKVGRDVNMRSTKVGGNIDMYESKVDGDVNTSGIKVDGNVYWG